jgi:uncharacterized protein with von Willebrand factor type A (vWA) domain
VVSGRLPENILYFARALREAGLPLGPGCVVDAIGALEAAGIGGRDDFYAILHAVFVKKHEQTLIFDQAFRIFWKRRGFMEQLIAMMSPIAEPRSDLKKPPEAGAARIAEALFKSGKAPERPKESLELDARFTMSSDEVLQRKDFAQMSAAEIALAQAAIMRFRLSDDKIKTRRFVADERGLRIDMRRTLRKSLRTGGAFIDLARRERATRHPPIVAICDISGSMSDYSRIFLHFLHVLTDSRRRVHTFLFGTRLTNVTRQLKSRDIDEALADLSREVKDWSGGTRIASSLHLFNRDWSRRVLGQGAIVLLFTDGLERDGSIALKLEMERLQKSCRRLIWLNPLLRYEGFEAKAAGIRTMLPFVDEFRAIHNLRSMADLVSALGLARPGEANPRQWLAQSAA